MSERRYLIYVEKSNIASNSEFHYSNVYLKPFQTEQLFDLKFNLFLYVNILFLNVSKI